LRAEAAEELMEKNWMKLKSYLHEAGKLDKSIYCCCCCCLLLLLLLFFVVVDIVLCIFLYMSNTVCAYIIISFTLFFVSLHPVGGTNAPVSFSFQ